MSLHLYSVVLQHRNGGVCSWHTVAANKREAVAKVRRFYEDTWGESKSAFALCYCNRVDEVGGYEIMLRRKVEETSA